jgi:hypothetical protein
METAYAGTSLPNGIVLHLKEQPGKPERRVTIASHHQEIDPDFWREWLAENQNSSLVADRIVWGAVNVEVVIHEAEAVSAEPTPEAAPVEQQEEPANG